MIGFFCFVAVFLALFWYASHLLEPITRDEKAKLIPVEIPNGAHPQLIARNLKKAGLIRNELAFTLMARVLGESQDMKAGDYEISPSLGVIEIINKLVAGDAVSQTVVIPEGLTLRQIATRLAARRLVDASAFIRTAHRHPRNLGLSVPINRRSADGYLMPDTYKFPRRQSERQIIRQMLNNWNAKVLRPDSRLFRQSDMPMDKIIIMASLIEREAKVPEDRAKIASVIRNRLKARRKLEIDATVLYALGNHKEELSLKDLKVDSPYNTYKVLGLPPAPICNPGKASIDAALKPARTSYLYYVAQPDGSHLFSNSYSEHKANIARVKEMKGGSS